jgi:hypothetical protein
MAPDVAPEDSVQSDAQVPEVVRHVRLATAFTPAFPGVQLVQAEAAFPENVPAGQSMQTKAAVPENLPAAQAEQVLATATAENLPAAQYEQVLAPTESENLPAVQSKQVLAPTEENLPAVQSVHSLQAIQAAVKPERIPDSSDVKVTWRKPVVDVYILLLSAKSRSPDRLLSSVRGEHEAE